jgi:hypothetical protein
MKPPFRSALLFFLGLTMASGAEPAPVKSAVNYLQPPVPNFENGLVRVWNAKGNPPQAVGQMPEARLGDTLMVEVKNIDQWLCQNLEAGAWATDPEILAADPLVHKIIEDRKLWPAVRGGKWRQSMLQKAAGRKDAKPVEENPLAVLLAMKGAVGLDDNLLPARDEADAPFDPTNPSDAGRLVEACVKASSFVKELRKQKAAQFIVNINDTPLSGLPIKAQEGQRGWRSASDQTEEGAYTWWQIKLRVSDDPAADKAWSDLMRAVATRFALQSKISLSVANELVALPTNVTATAEDSRCRFVLIAVRETPRVEKKMAKGEAVYPLDIRERTNEIKRAEIVQVDEENVDAPYVVHFQEIGGTKRYSSKDLVRLPPDPIPVGVIRVWNGTEQSLEWEEAQKDEMPVAKIGDHLMVEVRNFDGWLCTQVEQGLLRDDPLVRNVSRRLDALIKDKGFTTAVRLGSTAYRISNKSQKTAVEVVFQLQKEAGDDPNLAGIVFPILKPIHKIGGVRSREVAPSEKPSPPPSPAPSISPAPETPKPEMTAEEKVLAEEKKDELTAQAFLAPYREAHALLRELLKAKLRSVNLTINDLALGVTPDNADFTPIYESRRPAGTPGEDTYHWLRFTLAPRPTVAAKDEAEKAAKDPFDRLLEKPSFTMPSKVTLTLKSGAETLSVPTAVTPQAKDIRCRFGLIGIQKWRFWSMAAVFAVVAISLGFFAARTDILRDPCRRRPEGVEPVSLARTQMAFWFVVIAAAFLFLWVTTGSVDTINGTCLVLLAIGTTTALSADAISKRNNQRKNLADVLQKTPHDMLKLTPTEMQEEIAKRMPKLEEAEKAGTITPEEAEELKILRRHRDEIDCFLDKKPEWLPLPIYSWWYRLRTVFEDLLTEEAGTYDFHRFQMLAWTLVLGSIFVWKVFYDRVMPVFDTNVLLLMGISSGAYLGFKKVATGRQEESQTEEEKKKKEEAKPADSAAVQAPAGG